jgi:hypothetical protein
MFAYSNHLDRIWGPPNPLTGALSPGVKRQGREADDSPPTSADVKDTWLYTVTLQYVSMV